MKRQMTQRVLMQSWQARQPEHQRKMRARMDDFNRALRAADGDMLMYIKNLYKLQLSAGR